MAPRCTNAEGLYRATVNRGRPVTIERLPVMISSAVELISLLRTTGVDTLVCGGVSNTVRKMLIGEGIEIIDNITGRVEEVLVRIRSDEISAASIDQTAHRINPTMPNEDGAERFVKFNCLQCADPVCLDGDSCVPGLGEILRSPNTANRRMLEAAMDVSHEEPRRLCRLAEVVYFSLEMHYKRLGLAYCVDLWEPAGILLGVLERFFEVVPVCCKVGGVEEAELVSDEALWRATGVPSIACNPIGQAWVLNKAGTQFNVSVGLCVGADALFSMASDVPTSTLFVKDKTLAHNPIGALYSEHYLQESISQANSRFPDVKQRSEVLHRSLKSVELKSTNKREDGS